MTEAVTIRHVETETILLEDTYTGVFTGMSWLKACICSLLFFGVTQSIAAYMFSISPTPDKISVTPATVGVVAGALATLFFVAIGAFHTEHPAYIVSLQGYYRRRKVIPKTTLGNDQVAICRAAKELEAEAWVIINKERELEQIALKCNH